MCMLRDFRHILDYLFIQPQSALEGFDVAHILQEMLTYKSDHIKAFQEVLKTTIIRGTIHQHVDAP
ncbi:RNA polymerase Rpb2 domain 7 protein [Medicago truncatula]|uniref:RNA polymerase Rpb2 domain 7 protein n=1 Tax=Medicago truncatula TaxID=3880 RepID=G7KCS7_MEDTR|nr:RNA polymerase Rpb2 domain 7 protein [Medicago truncatula]